MNGAISILIFVINIKKANLPLDSQDHEVLRKELHEDKKVPKVCRKRQLKNGLKGKRKLHFN